VETAPPTGRFTASNLFDDLNSKLTKHFTSNTVPNINK
jgi:hypothetical protein